MRGPVLAALGWSLTLRGRAAEARPVLAEASGLAAGLDRLGPDWSWLHVILRSQIPLGEFEQARADSQELCRRARDAGALGTLSGALQVAADTAFRLGDWDAADVAALEAIQVAADVGQPAVAGWALTIRARILAARGRPEDSRAAAQTALGLAEAGISAGLRFVHGALGFLELGLDRAEAAASELEAIERLVEGTGAEEPTIVPWAQDLIEAYVRLGRDAEARRVLARLEDQAASSASPVAAAAAARSRGLLEEDFEPAFTRALALDDQRPMPFERSRTLLALGRRLHRAGRRAEARGQLRAAMEGFRQLGAEVWAGHAEQELRAAGGRRRQQRDARSLTPQERRVAEAVQRGASNRAIAADMFLSPKTVEFHLRQIYRKLDIHSRTQLVAALAAGPEPAKSR